MRTSKLDRKLNHGTDVASFYLFHPEDLAHRRESPSSWYAFGFACEHEFKVGTFVGFANGSDGGYGFRLTTGPLTAREKKWKGSSWTFRLKVTRGKVLLDNSDQIPSAEPSGRKIFPEYWIELPNGNYRVDVHAIAWWSEPGALDEAGRMSSLALANYVICFQPVARLESIPVRSSTMPFLDSRQGTNGSPSVDLAAMKLRAPKRIRTPTLPLVLVETADWQLTPGFERTLTVSTGVSKAGQRREDGGYPNLDQLFVLAKPGAEPGDLAVLARVTSALQQKRSLWKFDFVAQRLVRITHRRPKLAAGKTPKGKSPKTSTSVAPRVRVEAAPGGAGRVPPAELAALKKAFDAYAKGSAKYRSEIPNADFEREWILAMDSAEEITNSLIAHLVRTGATEFELLELSLRARVKLLLERLTRTT